LNASGATISQNFPLQSTGPVQETGSVAVLVDGNITTQGSAIALTGPITVNGSYTFSTGTGSGNITITGTLNGDAAGYDLVMSADGGDITITDVLGGATPFQNINLTGDDISWKGLGSTGIGATGNTILVAGGNIDFTGSAYSNGLQSYTAAGDFNITSGTLTQIRSNALPITFVTGTIQLIGSDLSIDSSGGNITLTPVVGPGNSLTVDADTGNLNFVQIGALGDNLDNVTLTATTISPPPVAGSNVFADNLVVNSTTVVTISTDQTSGNVTYNSPVVIQGNINYSCGGAGTVTFNKRVDASGPGDSLAFDFNPCTGSVVFNAPVGAVTSLEAITIENGIDVTVNSTLAVGSFTVSNNSGTTTITSGIQTADPAGISIETPVINLAGAITTLNGGPMVLNNSGALTVAPGTSLQIAGGLQQIGAGSVTIGGSIVTPDQAVSFAGALTLNGPLSINTVTTTGEAISFASTIDGTFDLTLAAGSHPIGFGGALGGGAALGNITIQSASAITASPITAATLTVTPPNANSTFDVITTSGLNGINIAGAAINLTGNITTAGSGPLLINNSGTVTFSDSTYTISGALTQSGSGEVTLAGDFVVGGAVSFAQKATLASDITIDTSATGQSVLFTGDVTNNLVAPYDLTIDTGGGAVTFAGSVGAQPIDALTIIDAGVFTAHAISASSITQTAGSSTTILGNLATTGGAGISLTGGIFSLTGGITTTNAGPLSITNSGSLTLNVSSSSIAGAFTQSGGGSVSLAGSLATQNQNISFANAVTLAGSTTISSGAGSGDISFSDNLNGNQSLQLTAGAGNITFGGLIGNTANLSSLVVTSVASVAYPAATLGSLSQLASTGTTTIAGAIQTSGALGVSIAGTTILQNSAITTTSSGPVTFANSGTLTVGVGVNTSASGSYTQTGGSVSLGGSIMTTDHPISIA
ncbi:MAG: hypothetical protein JSR76_02290, partial [Verrucomicrobia bacterium]|nr:hypothetical protein [Verrucomicrobiota bacterium]